MIVLYRFDDGCSVAVLRSLVHDLHSHIRVTSVRWIVGVVMNAISIFGHRRDQCRIDVNGRRAVAIAGCYRLDDDVITRREVSSRLLGVAVVIDNDQRDGAVLTHDADALPVASRRSRYAHLRARRVVTRLGYRQRVVRLVTRHRDVTGAGVKINDCRLLTAIIAARWRWWRADVIVGVIVAHCCRQREVGQWFSVDVGERHFRVLHVQRTSAGRRLLTAHVTVLVFEQLTEVRRRADVFAEVGTGDVGDVGTVVASLAVVGVSDHQNACCVGVAVDV